MKWKSLAAAGAMMFGACATLSAASLDPAVRKDKRTVSKEDVRKAIAIFRRNPLNAQGEMSRPLILGFAYDSAEIEVTVSPKRIPWINDKSTPTGTGAILLVAYMAGDILAQLDKGRTKDDPLAATGQVIATYRQLQEADAKLKLPSVEKLIALQKQGKLEEYFKGD